jgi:hypothetical protein
MFATRMDLSCTHQERHGHGCGWRSPQRPAVAAAAAPPAERWRPARRQLAAAWWPPHAARRSSADGRCSIQLQPHEISQRTR